MQLTVIILPSFVRAYFYLYFFAKTAYMVGSIHHVQESLFFLLYWVVRRKCWFSHT